MTNPLNRINFKKFIQTHGQVTYDDANHYADVGDEIIRLAMTYPNPKQFLNKMKALEKELSDEIKPHAPQFSISNMASCFLYAQTRANFRTGQGFGKGSNINQYGDKEQSEQTVRNLMTYFSQNVDGKECGYDGFSSHSQWRSKDKQLPGGIPNKKLRIDIDDDPKKGSIPAPLKGIHTAHLVPGVDKSGIVKLLVKPENWGVKKLFHMILHMFDYVFTRSGSQKIHDLEGRQETKLTKEQDVKYALKDLNANISKLKSGSVKDLFNKVSAQLNKALSEPGFDKPLDKLQKALQTLQEWTNQHSEHPKFNDILALQELLSAKIDLLTNTKTRKYGSEFQQKSEVRLIYDADDIRNPQVDQSGARQLKDSIQRIRISGEDEPDSSEQDPLTPQ